jgi:hypothetical protein
MELNKLEQDFKQKLEQRTIQPTEMAWDRLDAMLSVAEKQKKKPGRNWMYIAASFLALLLVGTFFLNKEKQDSVTNINNSVTETRSERGTTIDTAVKPSVINEPFTEEDAVATTTSISTGKVSVTPAKSISSKKSDVSSTVVAATNDNADSNTDVTKVKSGPAKINVDAADLLASVDTPAANEAIAVSAKAKKQSVKVNPNSLLSSVEGELDDSFRGKVLQSVAKNYDKIKTSVASRNHQ